MIEKTLPESSLEESILEAFDCNVCKIIEKTPNLSPEDCSELAYLMIGYHLGKCRYFGLTFLLEDGANADELRALSNGYFEVRDGAVRMGVLKIENLEKILMASYIKPGSVHICRDVECIDMPEHLDIAQIKKEVDMKRERIKREFESKIRDFGKNVGQHMEKVNAYKKKRDTEIARTEEGFNKTIDRALKKRLGEKDYSLLQQWLLEKRKKELNRIVKEIRPTENEDYDRQLAKLQDDEPEDFAWVYYFDNENKFREELKRDIGIDP